MAGYMSSKEIYAKSQNALNRMNNNITEINNVAQTSNDEEKINKIRLDISNKLNSFNSSLQQTSSLLMETQSSLTNLNTALKGVSNTVSETNAVLATSLVSLTQINSIISAFRSDYLLVSNGQKADGHGYYDVNLIYNSLRNISARDKTVAKILKDLKRASNYANKSSNMVRSQLKNRVVAKDEEDYNVLDKLLGKAQGFAQYGGILSLIGMGAKEGFRGKVGALGESITQADFTSLASLLGSFNKTSKIANPLKELGMKFGESNNPLLQMLSGYMGKAGFTQNRKEREKDPTLVMSSLAPFADDIKDIVEFKVKGMHERPSAIPDYAEPVWIVNSPTQTDYTTNKSATKDYDLKKKRLLELMEGRANNTKDIYGRDLYTNVNGKVGGMAARSFSNKDRESLLKTANSRIEDINFGNLKNNKFLNNISTTLTDEESFFGNPVLGSLVAGIIPTILGSHKDGKDGGSTSDKNYPVLVHHGERILSPEALQDQTDLDNTAKVLGSMIGLISTAVGLQQMKNQLLVKFINKEKVANNEIKFNNNIVGSDVAKELGGLNLAKGFKDLLMETRSKFATKRSKKQTTSEMLGRKNTSDNKEENKEVKEHSEQKKQETQEKINEIDRQSEAEVSAHQDIMTENTEEQKAEIEEQSEATIASYMENTAQREREEMERIDDEYEARRAARNDFEKKKMAIEKANKAKAWAIEKAGNVAARAKKMAETVKNFAIEKTQQAKNLAKSLARNVKRIAKKAANTTKRLAKKLALKVKVVLSKLSKTIIIQKAKAASTLIHEKIRSMVETVSNTMDSIATVSGKIIDGVFAIPVVGPAIAIGAGIAGTALLTGLTIKAIKKAKKGEKANIDEGKVKEDTNKLTKNAKKKVDSKNDKDAKQEAKEKKNSTQAKEEKENENTVKSINKVKTVEEERLERRPSAVKEVSRSRVEELQEQREDEKEQKEDIKNAEEVTASMKKIDNKETTTKPSEGTVTKQNAEVDTTDGPLKYLDKKQRKRLEEGARSGLAKVLLQDPKKASNLIFMLNNGSSLINLKDTKGKDLDTVEQKTTDATASAGKTPKDSIWGRLLSKLNKKKLKSDDLSSDEYSQNVDVALAQNAEAKTSRSIINAFAKSMGFAVLEDDNGNALDTTTIRKNAQEEALRSNVGAASTASAKAIAATTTSNSASKVGVTTSNGASGKTGNTKEPTEGISTASVGTGRRYRKQSYGGSDSEFLKASSYALSHGYKEKDGGTYPQFFSDYLKKDGISVNRDSSLTNIKNKLRSGSPVILMGTDPSEDGSTPYGDSPHYVVATGYDGKNIRVVDSESKNPYDYYDANRVLNKSSIKMTTSSSPRAKSGKGRVYSSKPKSGKGRAYGESRNSSKKRTVNRSARVKSISNNIYTNKQLKSTKKASRTVRYGRGYDKVCWSGDSRTDQMHNYFPDLEVYATKGGQTIDYFNSHYSEISDKEGYNIFCWYGVNGPTESGAKETAKAYNKLASDLKGKSQVFAGTIGHCPNGTGSNKVEGGSGQSVNTFNEKIVKFNEELIKNLSADVKVIDTYTFIKELEGTMGAKAMSKDNLHYTKECSEKIREFVDQQIALGGGAVATASLARPSGGNYLGDLYVTLQGYVDAFDTLSKYKKGKDLWDNVVTEEVASDASVTPPSTDYTAPTTTSTPSTTPSTSTPSETPSTTTPEKVSTAQPETETKVYSQNGTMYIVNNIEYGIKTNIEDIMREFKELNNIQDDSLDVLNIIYEKLLKRKGKNPKSTRIQGYDYSLQKRKFV